MNVLETEWWSLALPPEWWAEPEEESIVIGDRDSVGCIEITTLHREQGEFDSGAVREVASSQSGAEADWRAATLGEFTGVTADYLEDGVAIREWYLANGPLLLFVTYSCDEENRGMDDAAVEELLDTLIVTTKSSP